MTESLDIAAHGLIGDLRTCALVDTDGTVDWFCAPRFDSASVFGSILDPDAGGWSLRPSCQVTRTQQFYSPDTAILVTRFLTEDGVAEVHDFMPILASHDGEHRQRLVRKVIGVRGSIELEMQLRARPDYARQRCTTSRTDDGVVITGDGVRLGLVSTAELRLPGQKDDEGDGEDADDGVDVSARVRLGTGDTAVFVLAVLDEDADPEPHGPADVDDLLDRTTSFWRRWVSRSRYTGRWRETVHRSAITLKLLTHEPTGAIVAAPTTSLPEYVGGSRNWDYRFVWIRDAGFVLYALLRLGFTEEARDFIGWLSQRMGARRRERDERRAAGGSGDDGDGAENADGSGTPDLGPLRVLYDIDGNTPVEEFELDHLRGYRDSTPVRVGNAAVEQLQLDVYGELIDSVYLFNKYGPGISDAAWRDVTEIVDWVAANWDQTDSGMWEVRGETQAFTTSRLMCWVALERTIRMARQRGLPGDVVAWSRTRDEIYERIMSHCWNDELRSFTRLEDGDDLDAAVLLMPMVKFLSPADPLFLGTLAAVERDLVTDSLVFRYSPETDELDGAEGTFSLCTFWYVEALTRAGRLRDAQLALEKMFTYANHVGLYAEQVSATGDQVGNFPQAFTHFALISAAINLDRALDEGSPP